MSYILDALKKADADREREAAAVPDLHAQGDAALGAGSSARPAGWWLVALAAAAVALIVLAWQWFGTRADHQRPTPNLAQMPPTPSPQLPATPSPALPPPIDRPAQAPAAPPTTARAPAVTDVNPPPRPAAPAPLQTQTQTRPMPVAAAKAPAPAPAASAARLPTLAELPAELRSQLPALAVSGSVYSPQSAGRIVILNGQVFREGDKPIDGLTVEQIGLKSTVLAFRGTRFELKH